MPSLHRRNLLKAAAATGALAAASGPLSAATADAPFAGKSVLITGTSSGFGRLSALEFARGGAKVFATMRNLPRPEAEELRTLAGEENLDLTVIEIDVLDDEQVSAGVAEAERLAGGALDILVNNAGIVPTGPVEVHDMAMTEMLFGTNVLGYQRLQRAVLPAMRQRKSGLIFNVSSQVGRIVMPGMGLYSASKFAVESMSEQLAYELAPHGIEVVIIQPGGFPTQVGVNRARYNYLLLKNAPEELKAAYPALIAEMPTDPAAQAANLGDSPDPRMVPMAIAEIAMMAPGTRPLRRPVHPGPKPQEPINTVSREVQLRIAEGGRHGEWMKAVLD